MKYRVLVVDDSHVALHAIEHLLADSEFEVVCYCSNGGDAVREYSTVKPDLVLMDIVMAGMDGIDASRFILEKSPDARIIIVSALVYEDIIKICKEVGCKDIVSKPLQKETLLAAMTRVMKEP